MSFLSSIGSALAGPVGGALISGGLGFLGQKSANEASRQSVIDQGLFNERAYRNRYQWQMEDMRKARLNPILSYSNPPPSGPSISTYKAENTLGHIPNAINSAVSLAKSGPEIDILSKDALINSIKVDGINAVIDQFKSMINSGDDIVLQTETNDGATPQLIRIPPNNENRSKLRRVLDNFEREYHTSGGTNAIDKMMRALHNMTFGD